MSFSEDDDWEISNMIEMVDIIIEHFPGSVVEPDINLMMLAEDLIKGVPKC